MGGWVEKIVTNASNLIDKCKLVLYFYLLALIEPYCFQFVSYLYHSWKCVLLFELVIF